MKDMTMVNNPKKKMQIFNSLMSVRFYGNTNKTRDELWAELEKLEDQGELRIYVPERREGTTRSDYPELEVKANSPAVAHGLPV